MNYLVVDMVRVLDESDEGQRATAELNKRWQIARQEFEALAQRAQSGDENAAQRAAQLEQTVPGELAQARDALQRELSAKAKTIIATIAQNREVQLVLSAETVLAYAPNAEITDEIIAQLNA